MQIYSLELGKPVLVSLSANYPIIVVTDGFHFTKPMQVNYGRHRSYHLSVNCIVDNDRLLAGTIITILFFLMGLTSGILLIRFLSFLPILYFLYLFYIDKKSYLQLKIA